jgi:hypothetical protein
MHGDGVVSESGNNKKFYKKQQSAKRRTVKEPWGVFLPPLCVLVSFGNSRTDAGNSKKVTH